ncbi:uncharacterized protein LOC114245762 [Bombyx mandarina]|uniref:Uncharacterized protein n=2 Tax=Bombyx TaxID=7090 RepID=A0A8R2ALR1_BOMMO|nr:uncharacterized protein LOC101738102 [Bombyx mori]XP_028033840.1 uncharacterized protein LOC114245762 [Bombyx mandarina]
MLTYSEVVAMLDSDDEEAATIEQPDLAAKKPTFHSATEVKPYIIYEFKKDENTLYAHTGFLGEADVICIRRIDATCDNEYSLWFLEYTIKKDIMQFQCKHLIACLVPKYP